MPKIISKIIRISGVLLVIMLGCICGANVYIEASTAKKIYSDVEAIPKRKVGLVLGTSKQLSNGKINLYFLYRIQAAVHLYNSKKIEYVLISGDHGTKHYDEPTDFKNELVYRGIPSEKIFLDFAGFRTLDSVIRSKAVFGQDSITVISQEFHNQRAIFLAEHHGISAVGFNAEDLPGHSGFKTQIREYLAKTKAFIDIMFGVEPKFYGDAIKIE